MRAGTIRNALVIAPLSVLRSWEKEAGKILPQCVSNIRISVVSSSVSVKERRRILKEATTQNYKTKQR
jgi:SNF2 family DNA or RNA helicase